MKDINETMRKNAEGIANDIFDEFLEVAINNDMTKLSYITDYYKYIQGGDETFNLTNELGLTLAYDKIKDKIKHCSLIRIQDDKFDRFCLEASNKPLKFGNIGECLIYGLQ